MAHFEGFTEIAAGGLSAADFVYVRRSDQPAGSRDAKLGFPAIMRALWAAATGAQSRQAIGIITAVATLDFPSISSQAKADLTIPCPGAVVGDAVFLGLPAAPAAGLVFNAFVSAAGVVTVRASNTSSGSVDAASASYRAVVFKS
jgi:hypothetical protein